VAQFALTQTVLDVPGITCGHCERAITAALNDVHGIEQVVVDIPAKQVRITHDRARVEVNHMAAIMVGEGYPVASAALAGQPATGVEPVAAGGCSCCGPKR